MRAGPLHYSRAAERGHTCVWVQTAEYPFKEDQTATQELAAPILSLPRLEEEGGADDENTVTESSGQQSAVMDSLIGRFATFRQVCCLSRRHRWTVAVRRLGRSTFFQRGRKIRCINSCFFPSLLIWY